MKPGTVQFRVRLSLGRHRTVRSPHVTVLAHDVGSSIITTTTRRLCAWAAGVLAVAMAASGCSPTKTTSVAPSISATTLSQGFVQPGSVGYLGSVSALTSYVPGGAAPAGCGWQSYGLRCDGTTLTLDHSYVHGGIIFSGTGTVSITNSIIEGGSGSEWYVFYASATSSTARLTFTDSTMRWQAGKTYPSGYDVAPIWVRSNEPLQVQRCDLSGVPQGLDPPGGSVVKDNWIHGLVQNSKSALSPTHLDGIFSQGGDNITITGNYVDVPLRNPSDITAAVFFQNLSGTNKGVVVDSNYLHGGSYTLRNETIIGLVVTNNVFAGGTYGPVANVSPGTIATWSGNTTLSQAVVPKP